MNQDSTGERQQRLVRLPFRVGKPIETVLIDRILHTLRKVGLELSGREGDAIDAARAAYHCGQANPATASAASLPPHRRDS